MHNNRMRGCWISALIVLAAASQAATLPQILAKSSAEHWEKLPIGERMGKIAQEFVGTPYVGWTLDQRPQDPEQCTVTLEGLDCVTFMETTFNLARMIGRGGQTMDDLRAAVTQTRYRGGKVDGYLSRLHYTSDWIADNVTKGTVTNLAASLPPRARLNKTINFMSEHASVYPAIKAHPELIAGLKEMEARVTKANPWYIPKASIRSIEPSLRTGDIIALTGNRPGMDCDHVGLIIVIDKVPHFVHASSAQHKVVIGPRISEYVNASTELNGLMIARPN